MYGRIVSQPRVYVVPAAVSDDTGLGMMGYYNHNGASSSLSVLAVGKAVGNATDRPRIVVPVVTLAAVLASVPPSVSLEYLMTDMQGHDFRALRSAGSALRRVPYIKTEVWLRRQYEYEGAHNDFCSDFLPLMLSLGYEPLGAALDTKGKPGGKHARCMGVRCIFIGIGVDAAQPECT